MAKFRVLKTSYIQDGLKEPGDIVDIDPSTVNPEDENLEPYKEPKAHKEPAAPVESAPAPVAAKPAAPAKDDDDKKAPAKSDLSTPPAVLVSPDGKETPIPKPAPDKTTPDKPASGKP